MRRNFKLKIIGLVGLGLVFACSDFALARRVRDVGGITDSLHRTIAGIGYEQEAEKISALIAKIFPNLEELRTLSPEAQIKALAQMIKQNIAGNEDQELLYFELPEVLKNKKANCSGYAELFYVLGKALGLKVEAGEVLELYEKGVLRQGHIVNLIKLDYGDMILDLTVNYQILFDWGKNYVKEGGIWRLKDGSELLGVPVTYRIIRRVNEEGIIEFRHFNRGWILEQSGQTDEAIKSYENAKGVASAWLNLGLILFRQGGTHWAKGQTNEAISYLHQAVSYFDKAIAINPYFADAFSARGTAKGILGQVKGILGQYEEALEDLKKATKLNPSSAESWMNRGNVEDFLKRYDEAEISFKIAINLKPSPAVLAHAFYGLGIVYIHLADLDKALANFASAIQQNQSFAMAWFFSGYCKYKLGQREEAIRDYRMALALDPNINNQMPPEFQIPAEILPKL